MIRSRFDLAGRWRVALVQAAQETTMTILDPKTGELVTINLSPRPRR
ncbi:hypothetical protein [Microvirga sp. 2TAF3]